MAAAMTPSVFLHVLTSCLPLIFSVDYYYFAADIATVGNFKSTFRITAAIPITLTISSLKYPAFLFSFNLKNAKTDLQNMGETLALAFLNI